MNEINRLIIFSLRGQDQQIRKLNIIINYSERGVVPFYQDQFGSLKAFNFQKFLMVCYS